MAITYLGEVHVSGPPGGKVIDLTPLSLEHGDLVVVLAVMGQYGFGSLSITSPADYATLFSAYGNGASGDCNAKLFHKFMGETPDSFVSVSGSPTGGSYGMAVTVFALRGVDQVTPFEASGYTERYGTSSPSPPDQVATKSSSAALVFQTSGVTTSTGLGTLTAPSDFLTISDVGQMGSSWGVHSAAGIKLLDSAQTVSTPGFTGFAAHQTYGTIGALIIINSDPVILAPVRNTVDQLYGLLSPLRTQNQALYSMTEAKRSVVDQGYHMTDAFRSVFEQLWSVRMRAVFEMIYSDMPRHRVKFDMVWERFRRLRNQAQFEYGDKDKLVAALDQVYRLMGGVRNKADFRWAVTEKPIRTLFDQVYQIKDKNKQRAVLRQLWIMVMGDAILQKDEVTITARRGDEVRTLNRVYDIDQEEDSTLYYQAGDIKIDKANKQDDGLPDGESEFLFCSHLETEVTISVTGGPDKTYLVREPYRDRDAQSGEVFIVPLRSKTILLDEQESDISLVKESDLIMVHYDGEILTGLSEAEFAALDKSKVTARIDSSNGYGMRKSLVEMLAYPFSVEWNLPNTYLSANRLQIDNATRMTKIKEIVASLGGIVQSSDDGEELECKKEYKIPLAKLKQYIPEIELTDQEDAFRITQQHQSRPGYNRFLVTDRDISSDDIRTYSEQITAHQQQVQISWVPNTGQRCTLEKSRGNHVWIVNDRPRQEVVETQIEIVAGVGTTLSRPFYGFVPYGHEGVKKDPIQWEDNDLGDLDIDESGVVKSTVPGNTLATIRYFTKYYQFQVHDPRNENAQVWPVIL